MNEASNPALIDLRDLSVRFPHIDGEVRAVEGVTLAIPRRGAISLLGESGCGKSVTAKTIMGIVPGATVTGRIVYHRNGSDVELTKLDPRGATYRDIRGNEITMIFQEPVAALSPVHTVGDQVAEVLRVHRRLHAHDARDEVVDMFGRVGISEPSRRVDQFPFELSGGMCQRVMIAMALACRPQLLIADEPTTGLDVTIQAQILALIRHMQEAYRMAVLFITHDLGVVAEVADRVATMYMGMVVEFGPTAEVFYRHLHPYTRGLLSSMPIVSAARRSLTPIRGSVPPASHRIRGCLFKTRCPNAMPEVCDRQPPEFAVAANHMVRCWLYAAEEGTP